MSSAILCGMESAEPPQEPEPSSSGASHVWRSVASVIGIVLAVVVAIFGLVVVGVVVLFAVSSMKFGSNK